MYKAAAVLSALMKVYTIPCHDRGHINPLNVELNPICHLLTLLGAYHILHIRRIKVNVMLVLQSCTDCLQDMSGSSTDTLPTSSDGTFDIGNIKVEEDIDIKGEEEVNVKTEKVTGGEEEKSIDIKDEDEKEEEDRDTQEEEDVEIKEEVSFEDTI